jgi:hypothetical protein
VLTGCGHAGIVNTVRYARALTGVEHVHAVLGGFHLTGKVFEPIIGPTVDGLERMIGTLRRELLDKVLVVNERHLRRILTIYLHHFNHTRPHRTLAQLAPAQAETQPPPVVNLADHQVRRRPILGGLTNEYQIAA